MSEHNFKKVISELPLEGLVVRLPADNLETECGEILDDLCIGLDVLMNTVELHPNLTDLLHLATGITVEPRL